MLPTKTAFIFHLISEVSDAKPIKIVTISVINKAINVLMRFLIDDKSFLRLFKHSCLCGSILNKSSEIMFPFSLFEWFARRILDGIFNKLVITLYSVFTCLIYRTPFFKHSLQYMFYWFPIMYTCTITLHNRIDVTSILIGTIVTKTFIIVYILHNFWQHVFAGFANRFFLLKQYHIYCNSITLAN